jgi:hypothetical protein
MPKFPENDFVTKEYTIGRAELQGLWAFVPASKFCKQRLTL